MISGTMKKKHPARKARLANLSMRLPSSKAAVQKKTAEIVNNTHPVMVSLHVVRRLSFIARPRVGPRRSPCTGAPTAPHPPARDHHTIIVEASPALARFPPLDLPECQA